MAALTLDASAALRVVLESGRQSATIDLLAAVAAVYAPSLFVAETANALWKHVGVGHIPKEGARRTGAALLTFDKKLAALAQRLDIAVAG
jgi:predicted nucleic acid-binding protein